MPFDELTRFLQDAALAKELYRVTSEVDLDGEAAALTTFLCREFRDASPVLLFEKLTGRPGQLATNLLGNRRRMLRALGAENWDQVVDRVLAGWTAAPARSEWRLPLPGGAPQDRQRFLPRTVRRGLCQQVLRTGQQVDLHELPIPRSWAQETGPALTSGVLLASPPDGAPVLELVSLEVIAKDQLQPHFEPHHRIPLLAARARAAGRQLPVAVILGGDPLLTYAASWPLPQMLDPWLAAGLLRQESVNLIRARSVELDVPAEAEMIIEGMIDPVEPTGTGVLADAAGQLRRKLSLPVINVTALTHRAQPVLPARILSATFSETNVWSQLTERFLLRILRWSHPHLADLHLPAAGGGQRIAVLALDGNDTHANRSLAHAWRGLPQWGASTVVLLVPAEVNVRDTEEVWRAASAALESGDSAGSVGSSAAGLVIDAASLNSKAATLAVPSEEILSRLRGKLEKSGWTPAPAAGNVP